MPQPPLIQAMLLDDFYPHATDNIRLLQTHASWVVLTGPFAYKVKKPVDFGFLDFSTLEKRKHYCEEELRLNRQLAAELYLDVLPICHAHTGFKLGGSQAICDYCIKMRQFADGDLLDARLAAHSFDAVWMDELAECMAAFHKQAEQSTTISSYGAPGFLLQHIIASLDTGLRHPEAVDASLLESIRMQTIQRVQQMQELFAGRMAQGRIRDCHGDLHLGNIALFRGHPTPFDCIEFNPEYRAIDTLNDAAFLVMDCDAHGRADLSMRLLSRYLEHSGDYEGMPLLPLFLSYRAGVRGKVSCLFAEDGAITDKTRKLKLSEAAHYFRLAADYLLKPAPACLYAVGGLSGSGKSRLSLLGCGPARAVIIRSDATRKRIAPQHPGLPLYSDTMHRLTYQAMFDAAAIVLRAGWPVILDATFLSSDERQHARELAEAAGVPFHFLWLDIPEADVRRNIKQRSALGSDISDAGIEVLQGQLANYERPSDKPMRFLTSADQWPWPDTRS
ncbi:MAG: hypothetical protein AUK36_08915 [Zetaproteobacteria bacterium CG2_30_59_37]|nr:MAG: hypothetical protein AUK36_08915 [Zetaproteobacteria bacterium CG2_30_59_37]